MKKHRFTVLSSIILAASLLVAPVTACADEQNLLDQEYTVTVEDVHIVDGEFKAEYDEEIEVDGETYVFKSIEYLENDVERLEYTETSEKLFQETLVDEEGKEYEVGQEDADFPETYMDDAGVIYVLKGTKREEETIKNRTTELILYAERNSTKNGEAPETMKAESYIDPDTGSEKELPEEYKEQNLEFVESELLQEYWGDGDYTASMTFNHYEYTTFEYYGIIIQRDENRPMPAEYYYLVLQDQGLSGDLFRITDISWSGAEYTDGTTWYRDAVITGNVYNKEYKDTYKLEDAKIPDITYSTTTAIYEESDTSYDEHRTAMATITYVKKAAADEGNTGDGDGDGKGNRAKNFFDEIIDFFQNSPIAIVGLVLLILVIAFLIVFFAMKKKKKDKDEEGDKVTNDDTDKDTGDN